MLSYRYSQWGEAEEGLQLDHEDVMAELSDYLMSQGDVQSALRMMMQRGMRNHPMMGLQEMLQRLRNKRQETLDKYNLNSTMDNIQHALEDIVQTERTGIERRLDEARERAEAATPPEQGPDGGPNDGDEQLDQETAERLHQFLKDLAKEKQEFLDNLPPETGNALTALSEYEFLDNEAKQKYDDLMEQLREQVSQSMLQQMAQGMQQSDPEHNQRMKEMLEDLNQLLQDKLDGTDTPESFQEFMDKWQQQMGSNASDSMDAMLQNIRDRMQQMQSLMDSLSQAQRDEMDNLMQNVMGDMELQDEMSKLSQALSQMFPQDQGQRYPFRGNEPVDLQQAMQLLERLGDMEQLEKALRRAQYGEGADQLDTDAVRELLGDEEADSIEAQKNLAKLLEEAGYIRRDGDRLELTPKGMRLIGQKALRDIFDRLKYDRIGNHDTKRQGAGLEQLEEAKRYEYGDPFYLDLRTTVLNAVERNGPQVPVSLQANDFEVFRTERQTQSSTVLMLDLSWSMARRGSFFAAKKVILALHNLIKSQYPRDSIYIVGFSTYARELKPDQLPYITWDQSEPYTNMQQGLMVSQKLLARHKAGTKQILMISDGEPTAHIERGQIFLGYPPSPRTITETLREVRRCTRDGIVINVFMLDKSYYLKEFVDQLTKINRGRAFYTSPDTLGQYVMVDYLTGKKRRIA